MLLVPAPPLYNRIRFWGIEHWNLAFQIKKWAKKFTERNENNEKEQKKPIINVNYSDVLLSSDADRARWKVITNNHRKII